MSVKRLVALYKGIEFCTKYSVLNWGGSHYTRDALYTRSYGTLTVRAKSLSYGYGYGQQKIIVLDARGCNADSIGVCAFYLQF